jgi:hypothetical protein
MLDQSWDEPTYQSLSQCSHAFITLAAPVAVILGAYIHWRAVLLLLEWRDASGGCAVPVTQGPLGSVLQELRELGHDLLHIDQVRVVVLPCYISGSAVMRAVPDVFEIRWVWVGVTQ